MSDASQTVEPKKEGKEFHWLVRARNSSFVPAQWSGENWFLCGVGSPSTPAEMYKRGWRYGAVAKAPKRLRK